MLYNFPRNSPRLLVGVLAILSLCFIVQWQHSQRSELWTIPKVGKVVDQKEVLQSFITRLHEHPPARDSLDLPEGLQILRIEEINEETERIDNLKLSDSDFNASAVAHSTVVELIPEYQDVIQYKKRSQGIVTVGGGAYQPAVLVSIRMLRKTNCTLPVEVFVPDEADYDPYTCDVVFKELNAKCVILPQFENTTIARYQYKSMALLVTSFEDTLFLDADNFPIVDPAPWFNSEPYLSTGLITWPDFWVSTASPVYYRLINQTTPSLLEHASTEAGSILISRRKHAESLLLAFYYNLNGPGFYYELLSQNGIGGEGDKETWVAAARALNKPYYQVRERNHAMVLKDGQETSLDDIISMLQYDPVEDWKLQQQDQPTYRNREDATIVFLHCNRLKMNPAEVLEKLTFFQPETRERVWGDKQIAIDKFGFDMEAVIWAEVIDVACRYGDVLTEVDDKEQVCVDLRRFWWRILMNEEMEDKIRAAHEADMAFIEKTRPRLPPPEEEGQAHEEGK
jgi:alpha 1,2-mannosyltransferase